MIIIKAFASNNLLALNTKDVVNPIGELSAWAMTYAKDRGIYFREDDSTTPNLDTDRLVLHTFTTRKDNEYIELTNELRDKILTVVNWTYTHSVNKAKEIFAHELLNELITQFQTQAADFKSGPITKDANIWMPEWLSWRVLGEAEETHVYVWFSDSAFRSGYDDFELTVVPPIKGIDQFFGQQSKVESLLKARTVPIRIQEIQEAKDDKPETILKSLMFPWHNPFDPDKTVETYWDVLIYGEAGDNIDAIKEALKKYILANSTHPEEEWKKVYPDIFKSTEFIILPDWYKYAIPNRVTEAGIYSPNLQVSTIIEKLREFASNNEQYPEAHVTRYAEVIAHPYKSLQLTTIGSIENRDNKYQLSKLYPDYIAQQSTSQDFNRQLQPTRDWSEKLTQMLIIAEEMTPFSNVPRIFTKLVRDEKLYLVMSLDNINYLVAAKHNYEPQD